MVLVGVLSQLCWLCASGCVGCVPEIVEQVSDIDCEKGFNIDIRFNYFNRKEIFLYNLWKPVSFELWSCDDRFSYKLQFLLVILIVSYFRY